MRVTRTKGWEGKGSVYVSGDVDGGGGWRVVKREKKWALTGRGRVKYGAGHRVVDANNNNKGEIRGNGAPEKFTVP